MGLKGGKELKDAEMVALTIVGGESRPEPEPEPGLGSAGWALYVVTGLAGSGRAGGVKRGVPRWEGPAGKKDLGRGRGESE